MAVQEIQRWMTAVKKEHDDYETYREAQAAENFIVTEPAMSAEGYAPVMVMPEAPEIAVLEKIVALEQEMDLEDHPEEQSPLARVKTRVDAWIDEKLFDERREYRLRQKRNHLFEQLSQLAAAAGFHLTSQDLEYYLGREIDRIVAKHPGDLPAAAVERLFENFLSK